jgi:hypothetical protein
VKGIFKHILIGIGLLLVICVLYITSIYKEKTEYDERVRKIALVNIYQDKFISGLERIEFKICDSIYNFGIAEIRDTISENLAISDKTFPCSVNITYEFKNGNKKRFVADDFNCSGCSGINRYVLTENGIEYEYRP